MRRLLSLVIVVVAVSIIIVAAQPKGKGGGTAGVYEQQCAKCHGKDGKGIESLQPPDFTDSKWQSSQTDKMIAEGIKNGKGVMPGFKDSMSAAQVTAMVKYVRSFGPKAAKTAKK